MRETKTISVKVEEDSLAVEPMITVSLELVALRGIGYSLLSKRQGVPLLTIRSKLLIDV